MAPVSTRRRAEAENGIRMYFVYILKSCITNRTYTGYTEDVDKRLSEHNSGDSFYTRQYRPWSLIYKEIFSTKGDAIKREKYLKSAAGRKWIKKTLFY